MKNPNQTEMEILICCARAQMTPEIERRLQELLTLPIHWENLRRLVAYHKMIPLLFHHLSRQSCDTMPRDWFAQLRDAAHGHVVWNYHQLENLRQLIERLEAHGIPVIPYKGVTLSVRLYGGLELRHTGDLDIIVPPAEYWRAKALLEAEGLICDKQMTFAEEVKMLRDYHEITLKSKAKNLILELHWSIAPRYFSFPFATMNLWEHTDWNEFNDVRFRVPCDEDMLILLCVHGTEHAWCTLKWISDIAEFLRQPQHIDWNKVCARARTLRSERMVLVGLNLAHELLGAPLPDVVQHQLAQSQVIKRLTASLIARIRSGAKQPTTPTMLPFYLMIREHWRDRWRYWRMLFASLPQRWQQAQQDADDSLLGQLLPLARLVKIYVEIGKREWRKYKTSDPILESNAA